MSMLVSVKICWYLANGLVAFLYWAGFEVGPPEDPEPPNEELS
jgi:hypothetical protein